MYFREMDSFMKLAWWMSSPHNVALPQWTWTSIDGRDGMIRALPSQIPLLIPNERSKRGEDARTKIANYPRKKMAEPGPLVRVLIILMTCFLLFHWRSPAALAPTPPAGTLCIPRERDALRDFKAGLNDSGNILSSWRGADCCRWKGVGCSNRTGHIIALRINSNSYPSCAVSAGGAAGAPPSPRPKDDVRFRFVATIG
jgi:hypothetical protein